METPAPTNGPTKRPRPEPTPQPTPDEPDDDSRNDDTPKPSPRPTRSTPDPTRHQTPKPSDEPTKRPRPVATPSPTPQPQKQKQTPSPTHEPPTEHPTMDDNVDEDSDEIDFVGQCYFNKCRKCQGNCDSDDECGEGLVCYQRKGNDQKIPGCSRGSPISNVDYCIRKRDMDETPKPTNKPSIFMADEPTPHPTAHHVAQPSSEIGDHSNVLREVAKPGNDDDDKLGRCQGDCSSNDDCIGDLKCYKRKDFAPGGNDGRLESVPGCIGHGEWKYDYCYDPADVGPTPRPTRKPTPRPPTMPTGSVKLTRIGNNLGKYMLARCEGK